MSVPRHPPSPTAIEADPFDPLITRVAAKLALLLAPASGHYYDSRTVPAEIGRRLFLDAAAAGEFPAFRVGNRIVARRDDVHRWVESQPIESSRRAAKRTKKQRADDSAAEEFAQDDAALESAGLIPRKGSRGER